MFAFQIYEFLDLALKMASAKVVETLVTNNSPSQDSYHPDDLFQSRYMSFIYSQRHISSAGYYGPT